MKTYKFTLDQDFTMPFYAGVTFKNDWVKIKKGQITIKKGYSWDGCSPKIQIRDLGYLGTPDGVNHKGKPKLYYASLVHDTLYQFKEEMPITRHQADVLFLVMADEFSLKKLYYAFIRAFGWIYGDWKK